MFIIRLLLLRQAERCKKTFLILNRMFNTTFMIINNNYILVCAKTEILLKNELELIH